MYCDFILLFNASIQSIALTFLFYQNFLKVKTHFSINCCNNKKKKNLRQQIKFTESAGAVEYTNVTSAEGGDPPANEYLGYDAK